MKFEKQTFQDITLKLDGNEYVNCRFEQCHVQYGGGSGILIEPKFNRCTFEFTDAALNTMGFLAAMYRTGGQAIVEGLFDKIRKGETTTYH